MLVKVLVRRADPFHLLIALSFVSTCRAALQYERTKLEAKEETHLWSLWWKPFLLTLVCNKCSTFLQPNLTRAPFIIVFSQMLTPNEIFTWYLSSCKSHNWFAEERWEVMNGLIQYIPMLERDVCLLSILWKVSTRFGLPWWLRWRRQWHPTPVLLPGKSHGRRSLVGSSPWGR